MTCYLNRVKSLGFRLTDLCNLKCEFCGQANQIMAEKFTKGQKHYLQLDELKHIVDQLIPYKPQVYLWGGEPLVHPKLMPFVEYLRENDLHVFITTNGVLLDKFNQRFVDLKVTQLTVSIEGFREHHEKVRRVKGVYDKIINNILTLKEMKKAAKKVFPIIDVNLVITEENHHYLNAFCEYLISLKAIRQIRLQLPMFFEQSAIDEFGDHVERVFHQRKAMPSWSYFTYMYSGIDIPTLERELALAVQKKGVILYPPGVNVRQWFENPEVRFKKSCETPYERINVEPNGDLVSCTDFAETTYGNALETPIKTLYNNDIINAHRAAIGCQNYELCSRCSYLYLY